MRLASATISREMQNSRSFWANPTMNCKSTGRMRPKAVEFSSTDPGNKTRHTGPHYGFEPDARRFTVPNLLHSVFWQARNLKVLLDIERCGRGGQESVAASRSDGRRGAVADRGARSLRRGHGPLLEAWLQECCADLDARTIEASHELAPNDASIAWGWLESRNGVNDA